MICLTTYPQSSHEATVFKQWFANLSGLIPIKTEGNTFCFEPKEKSDIVTRERIFMVLQREMHFLEVQNYSIKEII